MVQFILGHIRNSAIPLLLAFILEKHGISPIPAIILFFLLIATQVWADLFDFEPVTLKCYLKLKDLTDWDPRQLDQVIERRIMPLCDVFNSLPETATLYSCEGHLRPYYNEWFLPRFVINGPYIMFRSECCDLVHELSDHLFADQLNNYWDLKGSFRPATDNIYDPGGDYVWVIRCQTAVGLFWRKRSLIDADIAALVHFLGRVDRRSPSLPCPQNPTLEGE
ncbi:hypothetical protein [Thalassospira marina]|uniref:Uncharacterized protein n=1 Tax=Thalassospira marina TaxID=2048283 RepID=A0A2N3KIT8_9PROT|nr:hypothetical protein [Thalassospira marina]PKR50479.1 hypothetical protein COO20_21650 [Thalassospira marina]